MMEIIFNLLLIQIIVVFIVDLSGIIDTIKKFLWKKFVKVGDYHNLSLKPISCSLCSTWWVCLIYLIVTNNFTLPYIAITALLALLAGNMADLMYFIKDAFTKLINLLYKLL